MWGPQDIKLRVIDIWLNELSILLSIIDMDNLTESTVETMHEIQDSHVSENSNIETNLHKGSFFVY